jgi:thiol-disulfide isomerase/thioredoxin
MFIEIQSSQEFGNLKENEPALLCYFSIDFCSVCKILKPKVAELIQNEFPKIKLCYINSEKLPDLAAQNRVFTAPTILVFFNRQEAVRKVRNLGIGELRNDIQRPYSVLFFH